MGGVRDGIWQQNIKIKSLGEGISMLYDTKHYCDVDITIHNQLFEAHRLILSARSDVLKKLLMCDNNVVQINEENVTIEGFEILLYFLHKGTLKNPKNILQKTWPERIIGAHLAGVHFKIESLVQKCKIEMDSWPINISNVFIYLEKGYEVESLRDRCLVYIKRFPTEVLNSSHFITASIKCISIILEIKEFRQKITPQIRIRRLMKWGKTAGMTITTIKNKPSESFLNVKTFLENTLSPVLQLPLLGLLDFHRLTPDEITSLVGSYKDLFTGEELLKFLTHIREQDIQELPDWSKEAAASFTKYIEKEEEDEDIKELALWAS